MADKVKESLMSCQLLDVDAKKVLLDLLAHLEGELQARELAVAAIKSECVKHILSNASLSPVHRLDPLLALHRDYNATAAMANNTPTMDSIQIQVKSLQNVCLKQRDSLQQVCAYLRSSESKRVSLEEELANREALVEEAEQRAKLAEQALQAKVEAEAAAGAEAIGTEAQAKKIEKLTKDLESVEQQLKTEQQQKMDLVMLLLNDRKKLAALYLEEKKRGDELAKLLREEQGKTRKMAKDLEEESKRSLTMENEVDQCIRQLNAQREETKKILLEENVKNCELEEALRRSRTESEHLRKQLAEAHRVAMSQASSSMPPPPPQTSSAASSSSSLASGAGSSTYARSSASSTVAAAQNFVSSQEHYVTGTTKAITKGNIKAVDDKSHASANNTEYIRGSGRSSLGRSGKITSGQQASVTASSGGGSNSNTSTVRKMVVGGASSKGPPPVPPNKPALTVYKNNQILSYTVSKQPIPD